MQDFLLISEVRIYASPTSGLAYKRVSDISNSDISKRFCRSRALAYIRVRLYLYKNRGHASVLISRSTLWTRKLPLFLYPM